ncbi:MAG: hypothetical protein JSS67_00100 [Bacteroidetes bacterium]|nr:hypothetical protein [Bacteroidota bacterium]
MNKFFRALIAGYGAKKLGGGCFSTILIFLLLYWALGTCNATKPVQHTFQQKQALTTAAIQPAIDSADH